MDFLCADARLIIELDGGRHALQSDADASRTAALESMGYLVLRFWNDDVLKNTAGVSEEVVAPLTNHSAVPPHPGPLPEGEREKRG
jgi:very-short-patch-repair endonuclease